MKLAHVATKVAGLSTVGWMALSSVFLGSSAKAEVRDCVLRGQVQVTTSGNGNPGDTSKAEAPDDGTYVRFFSTNSEASQPTLPAQGPRAWIESGRYECTNCFRGTNFIRLVGPDGALVGDSIVARCVFGLSSLRTDLMFGPNMGNPSHYAVTADEHQAQVGYQYLVTGRVCKNGGDPPTCTPIQDGSDEIDCTSFASTEHGERVPIATVRSPIVSNKYECPTASGDVSLSLASDDVHDCYLPVKCGGASSQPPQAPEAKECDAKFSIDTTQDCKSGVDMTSACTLTGVVRKSGAVPPASETIDCTLPTGDQWQPINDATGAYSCSTEQGSVTLHLSSGVGGNKTCTCSDTTTVCNVSF